MNMVKYDADQEIMITYENLLIVQSQLFTNMLIFIYIQSNLKIFGYQYLDSISSINCRPSQIFWTIQIQIKTSNSKVK